MNRPSAGFFVFKNENFQKSAGNSMVKISLVTGCLNSIFPACKYNLSDLFPYKSSPTIGVFYPN